MYSHNRLLLHCKTCLINSLFKSLKQKRTTGVLATVWTRNVYLLDASAFSVLCEKLAHPCNLIMCEKLVYLKCSLVTHGCCFYWCGTSMLCSLEAGTVLSGVFGK